MSLHEIDLAQKISDKIMCVKGDVISHYGVPEEIFREEIIRDLYEIDNGFFDPCFGSIELPRPEGEPEIFVLSSCGTGIPVFRSLQKENIPFAAGILYTNDIDYQLARLLAARVVTEEPFREISGERCREALELMSRCGKVINAGVRLGSCNRKMAELIKAAEKWSITSAWKPAGTDAARSEGGDEKEAVSTFVETGLFLDVIFMEESAFYDLQHIHGACFYADSAGYALRSIRAFFSLDHNVERTRLNTFTASGTELFVDHVHTLCVLLDGSGFTGLCTFSALYADHRFRLAFLLNNFQTGFSGIGNLVECLGTGFHACQTCHAGNVFLCF